MEDLDDWLDGLTIAKKPSKTPITGEYTLANSLAALRHPPVTVGYVRLIRTYHCLRCGEVSSVFEGIYRADEERHSKIKTLTLVHSGSIQAGLPIHSLERSRNSEECAHCITPPKFNTPGELSTFHTLLT